MKRLKIIEQIMIVLLLAVIIPIVVVGIIIKNVNQHSMRSQLKVSATIIAKSIANKINNNLQDELFDTLMDDSRQAYILDEKRNVLKSYNYDADDFTYIITHLPKKLENEEAITFGKIKNQPMIYYHLEKPELTIIVNTGSKLTERTIDTNNLTIILSLVIAALCIISLVGLYTFYLYINMRQLLKGIIALSKGNYNRQIRLLINFFTPREIVFIANEFNIMANEINKAYKELERKNKELKSLNEIRTNLIDTVSHEFRTPLTSIKGYTSRLLRQDINIDDEIKTKSLKIIKKQSERLERMVEDLLVIPDIEGANLNINLAPMDLNIAIENSILSTCGTESSPFIINIPDDFPLMNVDKYRFEQVLINVFENALKYAYPDTKICITAKYTEKNILIEITNKANYIEEKQLMKLFGKFTRLQNDSSNLVRGTGLGLFIVKGLMEAMGGKIHLKSTVENDFTVFLSFSI